MTRKDSKKKVPDPGHVSLFLIIKCTIDFCVSDPDPIVSADPDPDPGRKNEQQQKKKVKKFHVIYCWMFSMEGWRLPSCSPLWMLKIKYITIFDKKQ